MAIGAGRDMTLNPALDRSFADLALNRHKTGKKQ